MGKNHKLESPLNLGLFYAKRRAPLPEGLTVASAGDRIQARVLDVLSLLVVSGVLWLFGLFDDGAALGGSAGPLWLGVGAFVWETLWLRIVGATPGKLVMGVRIAGAHRAKKRAGLWQCVLRSSATLIVMAGAAVDELSMISDFTVTAIVSVSLLLILSTKYRQGVMDRLAGTLVLNKLTTEAPR